MTLKKSLALAAAISMIAAGGTAGAQSPETQGAFRLLQRIATQYVVMVARTFVDLTYDSLTIEPGTNQMIISGLTLYPELDWDQGHCFPSLMSAWAYTLRLWVHEKDLARVTRGPVHRSFPDGTRVVYRADGDTDRGRDLQWALCQGQRLRDGLQQISCTASHHLAVRDVCQDHDELVTAKAAYRVSAPDGRL